MEHDDRLSTRDIASGATETETQEAASTDVAEGSSPTAAAAQPTDGDGAMASLLPDDEQSSLRGRWEEIQVRFVDEPRNAVEDADALVASVMQRLADGFAEERERLEGMWGRGEDVGTEDLRVALQRYRVFFHRLLSA